MTDDTRSAYRPSDQFVSGRDSASGSGASAKFCPSRYEDEDLGVGWPCERVKDHEPPHRYSIEWNDEPVAVVHRRPIILEDHARAVLPCCGRDGLDLSVRGDLVESHGLPANCGALS